MKNSTCALPNKRYLNVLSSYKTGSQQNLLTLRQYPPWVTNTLYHWIKRNVKKQHYLPNQLLYMTALTHNFSMSYQKIFVLVPSNTYIYVVLNLIKDEDKSFGILTDKYVVPERSQSSFSRHTFLSDLTDLVVGFYSLLLFVLIYHLTTHPQSSKY